MREEFQQIIIDDTKYFAIIDNQVRKLFAKFEVESCLPKAEQIWESIGKPPLQDFPIEGYYYKSDQLRRYFTLIRNFQQNKEVYKLVKESPALEFLRNVLHTDIFGRECPPDGEYPWPDAPLRRRWDILTSTMQNKKLFDNHAVRPWTIQNVMANVHKQFTGMNNLPELAVLIGQAELVCAACETNSLGRMFAMLTGSFSMSPPPPKFTWKVRQDVEELGASICHLYNKITNPFNQKWWGVSYSIMPPTLELVNLSDQGKLKDPLDWSIEYPRVAHLGYVIKPDLNYFWILDNNGGLKDLYQKELLTTEKYRDMTLGSGA